MAVLTPAPEPTPDLHPGPVVPYQAMLRRQQSEIEVCVQQEVLERMEQLRGEMVRTMEILHSVRALFEVKPEVTRAEFRDFVQSALERLPEVQALEWIPRVSASQRASYEAAARRDGLAEFHFKEIDPAGKVRIAAQRPEYCPVFYAEPAPTNAPALGLDLASDPSRRLALESAAQTGLVSATAPLHLAQTSGDGLGFLAVMPVRGQETAVAGFGLAVFQIGNLIEKIFAPLVWRGIRIEIRDEAEPESIIYQAGPADRGQRSWSTTSALPLMSRIWRFHFTPGASFSPSDPHWLQRSAESLRRTNELLDDCVAERTEQLAALNQKLQREIEVRKAAEAAAAAANQAKTLFLAEMSHEIRTPLNVILGYTQLLQRDPRIGTDHLDAMRSIIEGGNHLLCLVNGVLDLAQIESGQMALSVVDFDLTTLVRGLAAMFSPRCQEKGLRLRLENLSNAPIWLRGDERKLRQVLVNLLGNAVKFTDSGEVRLRVVPAPGRDAYRFEVIDTGPGIALAMQKKIFEPFKQDTAGFRKGGTGLGLSIARRLIELMGGSLEVNSSPGWGCDFFFTLGFEPAHILDMALPAEGRKWDPIGPSRQSRCLVIESSRRDSDVLGRMLEALGCEVIAVPNGAAALDRLRQHPADVVVVDTDEEVRPWVAAIREALAGRSPALVHAACTFEHEREALAPLAFDAFLTKPFRMEQVRDCLAQFCGPACTPPIAETAAPPAAPDWSSLRLPDSLAERLSTSAEIGDFAEIRRIAGELECQGPLAAEFARRLLVGVERFDPSVIRQTLSSLACVA